MSMEGSRRNDTRTPIGVFFLRIADRGPRAVGTYLALALGVALAAQVILLTWSSGPTAYVVAAVAVTAYVFALAMLVVFESHQARESHNSRTRLNPTGLVVFGIVLILGAAISGRGGGAASLIGLQFFYSAILIFGFTLASAYDVPRGELGDHRPS